MAPGVAAERPTRFLEALDDGLDRLDLARAIGVERRTVGGIGRDVAVVLRAVAQNAAIACQREDGLRAVERKIRVLVDKFVENGRRVELLGQKCLIGVRIGALCPDLAVLADDELAREALVEHIRIVVHVVKADDERLFALRQHEGVAHHVRAGLVRHLAPNVLHRNENVAAVVHRLQDLLVLVRRDHPVIEAVALILRGIAVVEGPLRIGDDGVEKQGLHRLVRPPRLRELIFRPVGAHRVVGVGGGVAWLGVGIVVHHGVAVVGRGIFIAAGGQQREQHQRAEQQRQKTFHVGSPFLLSRLL